VKQDIAIKVVNLSKRYKIYSRAFHLLFEILGSRKKRYKEYIALDDINFEVKRGEVVGVIGQNGAGKSTLLKIIAGTLDPSGGEVQISGKLSAILELGTGFNPDLSGRENVIIGGMCLGMSKNEVIAKMNSIIEFSGLHSVIDQPFRTYSSGMQARLTFATAISVDPDILIVDEALAAGDAFFVSKSMRRIEEICKSGATVFFVSHSLNLVRRFCSEVIHIEKGRIKSIGSPEVICKQYELDLLKDQLSEAQGELNQRKINQNFIGNGKAEICSFSIYDENNERAEILDVGKKYRFVIEFESHHDDLDLIVSLQILKRNGDVIFSTISTNYINRFGQQASKSYNVNKGKGRCEILIENLLLGRGDYYTSLGLQENLKTQSYADFYHYEYMSNFFSVRREDLIQWVAYEQPVEFNVSS
jgi:lipopolysaccharide transport system ATP-binding protein